MMYSPNEILNILEFFITICNQSISFYMHLVYDKLQHIIYIIILGINFLQDVIRLYSRTHCLLLLCKLKVRFHPEGHVQDKLHVIPFLLNFHTFHHLSDGEWNVKWQRSITSKALLFWELDNLEFTVNDSTSSVVGLGRLEFVVDISMSGDHATVRVVGSVQILPKAPGRKEG